MQTNSMVPRYKFQYCLLQITVAVSAVCFLIWFVTLAGILATGFWWLWENTLKTKVSTRILLLKK